MTFMIARPADHPRTFRSVDFSSLVYFPHSFEVFGKSILEREQGLPLWPEKPDRDEGIPSVEKASTDNAEDFCEFNYAWQMYAFDLILMRVQEVRPSLSLNEQKEIAKKIFKSGYRNKGFTTNKAGTDTHWDVVNKTNEGGEFMKLEPIVCGGNRGLAVSNPYVYKGATVRQVRCFDGSKQPPKASDVNFRTHPHLVLWATIETRIATPGGGREVRPFEFQGIAGFPYFILVWRRDYFLFDANRMVSLADAEF